MADITKGQYVAKNVAAAVNMETNLIENCTSMYKDIFQEKINEKNGFRGGASVIINRTALFASTDGIATGGVVSSYNDIDEDPITAVVNTHPIVPTQISDSDATFMLSKPGKSKAMVERVLIPSGQKIGTDMEIDGFDEYVMNADVVQTVVGDFSDTNKASRAFRKCLAKVKAAGGNMGKVAGFVDADVSEVITSELQTLFNDSKALSTVYSKGLVGTYGGIKFVENENMPTRTVGYGSDAAAVAAIAAYVEGTSVVTLDADISAVAVPGDKITLDSIKTLNQQTGKQLTYDATRTIVAISGVNVTIDRPFYTGDSEAKQNVNAVSAAALVGVDVIGVGLTGVSYAMYPIYPQVAFAFSPIKLPALGALDKVNGSFGVKNVEIRAFTADDIDSAISKQRVEGMGSFTAIRPEWMGVVEVPVA